MRPAWTRGVDVSTPVVVFRAESYGALGMFRSLGRLGVSVHGVDHSPNALGWLSRYCAGRFVWDFDRQPPLESVRFLKAVGRQIGGRPLLLPTFDTRTVLVADHADELAEVFRFPRPRAEVVRQLYGKRSMYELCRRHGIPTAETVFPTSGSEVAALADRLVFPIVVKAIDGDRLQRRTGKRLMIVERREDLAAAFASLDEPGEPNLMLQEYIPGGDDDAWILNGYVDERSECRFVITGRKLRQHPVHTGMTSLGICLPRKELEETLTCVARASGYWGALDMCFRHDRRDGSYKLLDVNPRPGANFRLFVDRQGLDVVRTLYLDMTGQSVPVVQPHWGRRWVVEDKDVASCVAYRREGSLTGLGWARSYLGVREAAHVSLGDLRPTLQFLRSLGDRATEKLRRGFPARAGSPDGQ
jgi:predicted ATP-grasp superfamily ATP-dependent carboligase